LFDKIESSFPITFNEDAGSKSKKKRFWSDIEISANEKEEEGADGGEVFNFSIDLLFIHLILMMGGF